MRDESNAAQRQLEFAHVSSKIKSLQTERSFRDSQKLFFAEGIRNFVHAFDYRYPIDTIIYSEKLLISPLARKLVRKLKRDGTPFARVTPEQFREVSQTERASGIAVICHQQILEINRIKPKSHICWTALHTIRSPGNLGTLIRTSAAVGAGGFIIIGNQIDPFDPNIVRATMGALFKQAIVRTTEKQFYDWVKTRNLQVMGASPNGATDYDKVSYQSPTILMLGNERFGLTANQESFCGELVRIPMVEGTDSLNVAVAGSLLLYEVFRSSVARE
ncbi:MAG: RNA methyltransferase [Pyrinomonadaceae bacterium]|nr:RNA methyltransferase [Pyrinomonadaceae bacterium]